MLQQTNSGMKNPFILSDGRPWQEIFYHLPSAHEAEDTGLLRRLSESLLAFGLLPRTLAHHTSYQ